MSWCDPMPTPSMPSSVSRTTIGTSLMPGSLNPFTSPTGLPQSWNVRRQR